MGMTNTQMDPHLEAKTMSEGEPSAKSAPTCPNCDAVLVYDSGLYHCDEGCGAWDPEDVR